MIELKWNLKISKWKFIRNSRKVILRNFKFPRNNMNKYKAIETFTLNRGNSTEEGAILMTNE